jgi:ABC-type maltose transport system permease subunit
MLQLLSDFTKHALTKRRTLSIIFIYMCFVVFFANIYYIIWLNNHHCFFDTISHSHPKHLTFFDFIYYTTSVQTTSGFSHMIPNSSIVKCVILFQIISVLFIIYGSDEF